MYGNTIVQKIEVADFLAMIRKYKEDEVECTIHTFFRLSDKQKQVYTEGKLKSIVAQETPFLVCIQQNRNYAVFYRYQNKILKIILAVEARKVNIVTFYFIKEWQIPKL